MRKIIFLAVLIFVATSFKMEDKLDDPQQCIEEKCPTQWAACLKNPKCQPDLQDCQKKCGTKQSCWELCLGGKHDNEATNVAKCAAANDCLKKTRVTILNTPQDCVKQYCSAEQQACKQDRRCIRTLEQCDHKCHSDEDCWKKCLTDAKEDNANKFMKCFADHDCKDKVEKKNQIALRDPQQCIEDKCPTQWAACLKDDKCQPALDDCMKKCGSKVSCWALCLPPKGSQAAIDVAKCAQANDCLNQVEQIEKALALFSPQDCIRDHCPDQAKACQQDQQCLRTLQDCEHECNDNQTCWSNCVAKKGNPAASAFWKCIIDNDCLNQVKTAVAVKDPQQCIEEKCPTQWAACQKNPKCQPDLQDCQKKCGTKQSCWELCLGGKHDNEATNVAKCAAANDCLKETRLAVILNTPQECIEKYCKSEEQACEHDRRCIRTLEYCNHKCANDSDCWKKCLGEAKQLNADKYIKCIVDHDCMHQVTKKNHIQKVLALFTPQECIKEHCPDQSHNCQKDQRCLRTLQYCDHECKDNQTCWSNCISKSGDPAAVAFWTCVVDYDCLNKIEVAVALMNPHDCLEQKCADQWKTCESDAKCIPDLHDCHKRCGDKKSCWELCLSGKKDDAATNVMKCGEDNGCFSSQIRKIEKALALFSPQDCIRDHCPDQAKACQQDQQCLRTLQDCEHECNDNQTCWSNCVAKKGNPAASAFWKCIIDNDCLNQVTKTAVAVKDPQQCIEEKCPTQWAACLKNPKCQPDLQDCQKKCGTKQSCWELCLGGKHDNEATNVAKCAAANDCLKESRIVLSIDPQECIEKYCKKEEQACENDRRCVKTLQFCDHKCNTTESCWRECLEKAKDPNASHYMGCIVKNHCINATLCKKSFKKASKAVALVSPQDCIRDHCPDQAKACQQDHQCLRTLQDCEHECNDNQTCWSNCVAKKGNPAASAFWKCIIDNDCLNQVTKAKKADPIDCVKEKCPNEYAACVKDSKCEPTLDKCNKKCGSSKSCWEFCLAGADSATVNVAKCAAANHCVGSTKRETHPFIQCMSKTCVTVQMECLYDKDCSKAVRKCMKNDNKFDYDHKCLSEKAKESDMVNSWYRCAGESFCL